MVGLPAGGHKELLPALNASGHLLDGGAEWKLLTSRVSAHFEHAVVDEPPNAPGLRARLAVTVWYPAQFAELRRVCLSRCGGEDAFCASLSRCHRRAALHALFRKRAHHNTVPQAKASSVLSLRKEQQLSRHSRWPPLQHCCNPWNILLSHSL